MTDDHLNLLSVIGFISLWGDKFTSAASALRHVLSFHYGSTTECISCLHNHVELLVNMKLITTGISIVLVTYRRAQKTD